MSLTPITTHVVDAEARLLEWFKGMPKFKGLLGAFTAQAQATEDAVDGIQSGRGLYSAVGAQLDNLGSIVGVTRPDGLSDDSYRLFVLAKIGQNVSGGETEAVITMLSILTGATTVRLEEHFPAEVLLFTDGTVADGLSALVITLISNSIAAGVSLDVIVTGASTNPFCFDLGGGGFGDALDLTAGGQLASVLT